MMRIISLLLSGSICAAQAQDDPKPVIKKGLKEVVYAQVAVVALGPRPVRRYKMPKGAELREMKKEIEALQKEHTAEAKNHGRKHKGGQQGPGANNQPVLLAPHRDEVPPASLYLKEKMKEGTAKNAPAYEYIPVGYNNSPSFKKIQAGVALKFLRKVDAARNEMEEYISLDLGVSPGSRSVVFLRPTGKGSKLWEGDPKVSVLNLDSPALAEKDLLVKNFSNKTVSCVIGEKRMVINPLESKSYKFNAAAGSLHRFQAVEMTGKKTLVNTGIRVHSSAVNLIVFYPAHPQTNAGKDVGVMRTAMPMPKKPPEPKEKS